MRRPLATALAIVVLVATVTVGVAPARGTPTILTADADTPLTTEEAKDQYRKTGSVTVSLRQVAANITIADEHEDVGLDGWHRDTGTTYVRIDYREEIPRTLRVYVPPTYFVPRPAKLEPVEDGPTATLRSVENGTYSSLRVDVEDKTTVVYEVSSATGSAWGIRGGLSDLVSNTTGISLPSFGSTTSGGEYEYVDEGLTKTSNAELDGHPNLIQYDAASGNETTWVPVPDCKDPADQRLCYYRSDNTTILMSSVNDPPTVRYKAQATLGDRLTGGFGKLGGLDEWAGGVLSGLFGDSDEETTATSGGGS